MTHRKSGARGPLLLVLTYAALAVAFSISPALRAAAAYDAPAVLQHGEVWRLVTSLLVHTGPSHAALNIAGLLGLAYLWPDTLRRPRAWLQVIGLSSVFNLCWVTGPTLGLSGVLHGVFAYFALSRGFRDVKGRKRYRGLLVAGLLAKVALEAAAMVDVQGMAWKTHVTGAVAGLALAALEVLWRGRVQLPPQHAASPCRVTGASSGHPSSTGQRA